MKSEFFIFSVVSGSRVFSIKHQILGEIETVGAAPALPPLVLGWERGLLREPVRGAPASRWVLSHVHEEAEHSMVLGLGCSG